MILRYKDPWGFVSILVLVVVISTFMVRILYCKNSSNNNRNYNGDNRHMLKN